MTKLATTQGIGGLALDALVAVCVVGPMGASLLGASDDVAALAQAIAGLSGPAAYVAAVDAIPRAFAGLGAGAAYSAVLAFGAALIAVTRYALLRPEAREARAVRAFVQSTAAAIPDASVPRSARLLTLLAPSTSLKPALLASIGFVILSGAAMAILTATREIRLSNAAGLAYAGWPKLHIESGEVAPPAHPAGRSLANGPSLIVGRDRVQLGASTITGLDEGELIPGWETQATAPALGELTRPLLVASPNASLTSVVALMQFFQAKGATEFQLVIDRHLPGRGPGEVQAAIPLSLGAVADDPSTIDIEPSGVRIGGSVVKLSQLRQRVSESQAPKLGVRAHGPMSYGQLVEVLAAADGVCEGADDCGLPGRGLRFVLQAIPATE